MAQRIYLISTGGTIEEVFCQLAASAEVTRFRQGAVVTDRTQHRKLRKSRSAHMVSERYATKAVVSCLRACRSNFVGGPLSADDDRIGGHAEGLRNHAVQGTIRLSLC